MTSLQQTEAPGPSPFRERRPNSITDESTRSSHQKCILNIFPVTISLQLGRIRRPWWAERRPVLCHPQQPSLEAARPGHQRNIPNEQLWLRWKWKAESYTVMNHDWQDKLLHQTVGNLIQFLASFNLICTQFGQSISNTLGHTTSVRSRI